MHLNLQLPTSIEIGARRILHWEKETVTTDGGTEVRNTRWSKPLRYFDISYPNRHEDDADHAAVEQMWIDTKGGVDTFNFYDSRAGEIVKVRFDTDLQFTHSVGPFHRIETITLKEVRP